MHLEYKTLELNSASRYEVTLLNDYNSFMFLSGNQR